MWPHLVIEVVERRFVFRKMAEITFRKVPYPQLIPEKDSNNVTKYQIHTHMHKLIIKNVQYPSSIVA